MPIYTYKCKSCGEIFEKMKSMGSNGTEVCQICKSEAVRMFSPAGIIFKGSGFYTTDYKSNSSKNSTSSSNNFSESKRSSSENAKSNSVIDKNSKSDRVASDNK